MKCLIDGDLVAFRCSAAAENDDEGIAKYYADRLIDDCITNTQSDSYELYLTGTTNFRNQIYPEYKANRLDVPRPRHLPYLRSYLVELGAVISDNCEADDLLGVAQCSQQGTVIASLDKDLLTIPGMHYSWEITGTSKGVRWVKEAVLQEVDHISALRWFYTQCLTGDVADNIKGVAGIGKVKARNILAGLDTEQEFFDAVREAYDHDDAFILNARCLHIWHKLNDDWRETFNRLKGDDDTSQREAEGQTATAESPGYNP